MCNVSRACVCCDWLLSEYRLQFAVASSSPGHGGHRSRRQESSQVTGCPTVLVNVLIVSMLLRQSVEIDNLIFGTIKMLNTSFLLIVLCFAGV